MAAVVGYTCHEAKAVMRALMNCIFASCSCVYDLCVLPLHLCIIPDNQRSHVHNQKVQQTLFTQLLHNIECLSLQWSLSFTGTFNTHSLTLIPVLSSVHEYWYYVAFWRGCLGARLVLGTIIIESIIIDTSLYYCEYLIVFTNIHNVHSRTL